MKNKFKITFVFSGVIIVCWLSILTCYAQSIDGSSANELKLNSSEINREEMPNSDEHNSDGSYLRNDAVQNSEDFTPAQEKHKVLIESKEGNQNESANDLKLNSSEINREEMPNNDEQNSDGSYLRSADVQNSEDFTPSQEKSVIHHEEQEKNKLPASNTKPKQ